MKTSRSSATRSSRRRAISPRCRRPAAGVRTLRRRIGGPCRRTARSGRRAAWPTCAPTARRSGRSTQGPHQYQAVFARILGLPRERVRVDLHGRRRHVRPGRRRRRRLRGDAAVAGAGQAGARAVDARRRARLGPEGPAAAPRAARGRRRAGRVVAWETRAWLPVATANLPSVPLLAPDAAKIAAAAGPVDRADPPEHGSAVRVPEHARVVHWIADAPLRTSRDPRAGQDRQHVRGRVVHRRDRGAGRRRSARVPAEASHQSARRRGAARGGARMGWQPRPVAARGGPHGRGR